MSAPTRDAVMAALHDVLDPCSLSMRSPTDIVDLGLVDDVEIDGGAVRLSLVLTDPSCLYAGGIRRHIADSLAGVPGVESVEVSFSATTFWTPARTRR